MDISFLPVMTAGVDEAGRGPLAGPVIAAAVILNPDWPVEGVRDSKLLTASKRAYLAEKIKKQALYFAVGRAEVEEIDTLNILEASMLAMQRAVTGLGKTPALVLVDGNRSPQLSCQARTIIGGDKTVVAISAASIIAKDMRDTEMAAYDKQYPGYEFALHKGYPTRRHCLLLNQLGISPIHRRSFGPVKALMNNY